MPPSELADYHTHCHLCHHAKGGPLDYARRALSLGLAEIGASCHNPFPGSPIDSWRMAWEDLPSYVSSVDAARSALSHTIPIRLGLECDFLPGRASQIEQLASLYPFDYFIGSVHYLDEGVWALDDPAQLELWGTRDLEDIWQLYWARFAAAASSGLFDFMAHPDLVKKFNRVPPGDLSRFYEPAIQAMLDADVAFEINTAGLHKDCAELYPATRFLELAAQARLPVLISSDAHDPAHVGRDFAQALYAAHQAGLTHTARFQARQRTLLPLPTPDPSSSPSSGTVAQPS